MKNYLKSLSKITTLFLLLFLIFRSQSQSSVIILHHADISKSIFKNNEVIGSLIGNVYVTLDTIDFYCDSAKYYPARDLAKFYNNVKIIRNLQNINADSIYYYRQFKKAIAWGDVHISEPSHLLKAKKIIYETITENSEGFKNVIMHDTTNGIYAKGEHYQHFATRNELFLFENVKVLNVEPETQDTTTIFCDSLYYKNKPDEEMAVARGKVKILRNKMIATGGLGKFYISADSITLEKDPLISFERNKIQARKVKLILMDGKISEIRLYEKAELHSYTDSTYTREDILKGNFITMFFKNDSLYRVVAVKNAIGKYNIQEEGVEGLNYVTADSIKIFIKNNKADSLYVSGGTEGTYYPDKFRELAP